MEALIGLPLDWTIFMSNGFDSKAAAATEIMQDQNAIQAAHDAGVPHIVFSTLDGGYGVVHSDSKAEGSPSALRPHPTTRRHSLPPTK